MALAFLILTSAPAEAVLLWSDHQVLQRGENNAATAWIEVPEGVVPDGEVRLTLRDGAAIIAQETLATPPDGPWGVAARGIPTGGPYTITAEWGGGRVSRFDGILVGDLWVLGGQSNMQGAAPKIRDEEPWPTINMLNTTEEWMPARTPIHRVWESQAGAFIEMMRLKMQFDDERIEGARTHSIEVGGVGGIGPGFFFARRMVQETGVPIGLIPCAFGGTTQEEWDPARKDLGRDSLYGYMLWRVGLAGGRVRGLLWYQGESETMVFPGPEAGAWGDRFIAFCAAVRADLEDPDLPVLVAQLSRFEEPAASGAAWEAIRERQRLLPEAVEHLAVVPTVDLTLSDVIHLDYVSQRRLGRRFAWVAAPLVSSSIPPRLPIALDSVAFANTERTAVTVRFAHITGELRTFGPLKAFEVRAADGVTPLDIIAGAEVDPSGIVTVRLSEPAPAGAQLIHAPGANPRGTLIDSNDMAAPAFGPVVIGE